MSPPPTTCRYLLSLYMSGVTASARDTAAAADLIAPLWVLCSGEGGGPCYIGAAQDGQAAAAPHGARARTVALYSVHLSRRP
jgi:hypothetical protein